METVAAAARTGKSWRRIGFVGAGLLAAGAFVSAAYLYGWAWTGFGSYLSPPHSSNTDYRAAKTLWDWLGLLLIPLALALGAAWYSARQAAGDAARATADAERALRLGLESIQAQTFMRVVDYERQIDYPMKMKLIRELHHKQDYIKHESDILEVVNLLNYVGHLIRHRFVLATHVLLLYAPSIDTCHEKLVLPTPSFPRGWINSARNKAEERYFLHFQCLVDPETVSSLWLARYQSVHWPLPKGEAGVMEELSSVESLAEAEQPAGRH